MIKAMKKIHLLLIAILLPLCSWAEEQGYAVFNFDTETLIFKYGDPDKDASVATYGHYSLDGAGWEKTFKKVVFESSFSKARPTSTACWFQGATSLTEIVGLQYLNTSEVTDMHSMFEMCGIESLDLSHFNTAKVADMSNMFSGCGSLSLDLSSLNTANVTDMHDMFNGCNKLKNLNLSGFKTTKVTDMSHMFHSCTSLTNLDLSSFNTANVTNMSYMFHYCIELRRIYAGSQWNTANVTSGEGIFVECKNLVGGKGTWYDDSYYYEVFTDINFAQIDSPSSPGYLSDINDKATLEALGAAKAYAVFDAATGTLTFKCGDMPTGDNVFDVSNTPDYVYDFKSAMWDNSKVKKVVFDPSFAYALPRSTAYWFFDYDDNPNLTEITGLQYLNTSSVTNMSWMFYGLTSLKSLDVSHFDTHNVTKIFGIFSHCSGLTSLDVSNFETSNMTIMGGMFEGCSSLTSLDVSHFDTSNVTDMGQMFSGCSSLKSLDVSHFNTSNVTNMIVMFENCSGLTSLDVSHFDTSNVTDIRRMFDGCSGLKSLDVSNFNTANVEWMSGIFVGCSGITHLDVSRFNTENVRDMWSMFNGCSGLTSLDLSNFNTSKVEDMDQMFYGCSGLTSIDLSSFDTNHLSVPRYEDEKDWDDLWGIISMFEGCTSLAILDLSSFDTGTVEYMTDMFAGCSNLKTIYVGEKWSTENLQVFQTPYVKIDGHEGLFTGCEKLVGGKGTKFNANYPNDTYARIDAASAPGYFTLAYMDKGVSYLPQDDGSLTVRDVSEGKEQADIPSSLKVEGQEKPVKGIGAESFKDNTNLIIVSIPESIEEIGTSAFAGCSGLKAIYCYVKDPVALDNAYARAYTRAGETVSSTVFAGVDKETCILYVPVGSVANYRNAAGWKEFAHIEEMPSNVKGDASGNWKVDQEDINMISEYILTGKEPDGFIWRNADVNVDNKINVADIVEIGKLMGQKE